MIGPFSTLEEAEKQARQLKQYQGWSSFQQQVFQGSIEKKADGTWGSKFVKRARNEIFLDVMGVDGLTQAIDIPTLLVLPEKGLNRTQWQIKPFQIYLPNLEIARVKGNHWAFLVEPEDFNRTVASFLLAEKINKKN